MKISPTQRMGFICFWFFTATLAIGVAEAVAAATDAMR